MKPFTLQAALALLAVAAPVAISFTAAPASGDLVAIKAGRIHTMDWAGVIQDGVLLVRDGKIVDVGSDIVIPAGAQVVDYGRDADLIPGLVAADSGLARSVPDARTADAGLFAVDGFDTYANRASLLAAGVTSAYIDPTAGRLIGGIGGVVKLGGDQAERILDSWASLDGSISSDAYRTRGFWEPPVPATSDVGMGVEQPQLPHSLQGAILALGQLADVAAGDSSGDFGPHLEGELRRALDKGASWRFKANTAQELRAISSFAKQRGLELVVDGAWEAKDAAEQLREAGIGVVFEPRQSLGSATNWGKGEDAEWPSMDVPAALVEAGVTVAIAPGSNANLTTLYSTAMLASGGLTREQALATVTCSAAQLIGAGDRIGRLKSGMDADFVVLSGAPMTTGSSVRATWVDGQLAWLSKSSGSDAVVLEVDELFVGDGSVLRPGQILMRGGKIQEVGEQVAHPRGATTVRGAAAMPGIIDALGHLGLGGSRRAVEPGFSMTRVLTPGDATAKHVAEAGVTTVMLSPYSISGSGSALLAYKPAADDFDSLVIEDDAALRITWSSSNRYSIGSNVRSVIDKAVKYRQSWIDYEKELSEWTPPAAKPDDKSAADESDDKAAEEKSDEDEADSKKKGKKQVDPDALTGVWTATSDWGAARFQFKDAPSEGITGLRGSLRSDALSERLLHFTGSFDHAEAELVAEGEGASRGLLIAAKIDDEQLEGTITWEGQEHEFAAERQSREYVVVKRPELRKQADAPKPAKGTPKAPRLDPSLEPWRRALDGEVAVIVSADRDDEILDAVNAFAAVGIKPVLFGAEDAWRVKEQIAGRVAGILPQRWPLRSTKGIETVNRFAELQEAGIPVAFYSDAEEGAGDLFLMASFAVAEGMSPSGALRALTADAAAMMGIDHRVGRLAKGLDADVLLLDQSPMEVGARIKRTWVAGEEVVHRAHLGETREPSHSPKSSWEN